MTTVLEQLRHPGHVRTRAFGPADEYPYRRLTAGWVRVVTAAVLLALSALHFGNETSVERGAEGVFELLSRLGSLWAVLLVAAAAVITYRMFTSYLPPIPGSSATKWPLRTATCRR